MGKIYILESRRTVGAYKTIQVFGSLDKAIEKFEEIKRVMVSVAANPGIPCKTELTKAEQAKNKDVIAYFKIGGSHNNEILRIREDNIDD